MRTVDELEREALDATSFRGHQMTPFNLIMASSHTNGGRTVAFSRCRVCDRQVTIDTRPAPNGIDIGGEAVAVHCGPRA